jgi:hypothetical protein
MLVASGTNVSAMLIAVGDRLTSTEHTIRTRTGVGAAPAEAPPVLRGPREVCAGQGAVNLITGAASDPVRSRSPPASSR